MKTTLKLAAAALAILSLSAVAAPGDEEKVVRASISNPGCRQKADPLIVPAGKVAMLIHYGALRAGNECVSGKAIDSTGFTISWDNPSNMKVQDVYTLRMRGNVVSEDWMGKPAQGDPRFPNVLGSLILGQGKYYIFVGGGDGAVAEIIYTLRNGTGMGPMRAVGMR